MNGDNRGKLGARQHHLKARFQHARFLRYHIYRRRGRRANHTRRIGGCSRSTFNPIGSYLWLPVNAGQKTSC
jgi:hypothetical protein